MRSLRRYFWRMPLHLRVIGIVGVLLGIASLACLVWLAPLLPVAWSSPSQLPSDFFRVLATALSAIMLGLACVIAVRIYCLRFREPHRKSFPLSSWQSQLRAVAVMGAVPLVGLVVALVLPSVPGTLPLELGITAVAAVVTIVTYLRATREAAAMR
jgi:hypothetical protein